MYTCFSRWVRRVAVLSGALVLSCAAVLTPVTAASAASDGTDWSGSWQYYTSSSIRFDATLPGLQSSGFSNDYDGTRQFWSAVTDSSSDGQCARVMALALGQGWVADTTACNSTQAFTIGRTTAKLFIFFMTVDPAGNATRSFFLMIPPSVDDPGLRAFDTGMRWSYYSPPFFDYEVRRDGVKQWGHGGPSGSNRFAQSGVQNTGHPGCVSGHIEAGPSNGATVCGSGAWTSFYQSNLSSTIFVRACSGACLEGYIPQA
jgi:hypothetical protein